MVFLLAGTNISESIFIWLMKRLKGDTAVYLHLADESLGGGHGGQSSSG
jgi:hypothetical protein